MKTKITIVVVVAVLAATIIPASLASFSTGSATVASAKSSLGRILVNGSGRTLYLFARDKAGKSSCYGGCAAYWPPLLTKGKPIAKSGTHASLLGRTKRRNGRWQVTYNHHPLYTFIQDSRKGQTRGEGLTDFGGEWDAVSPAGAQVDGSAG